MPNKVQLKLLSKSGELLNVTTCNAGKISVLRATTPSDLRPYQRALSGSSGRDNLEVLCDGASFNPDDHTLIGFGEPSPTIGLTVREFATKKGISELALPTQLLNIGLDDIIDKRCAELTLDQEARLRLLAVTGDPDRVIVLNDPFENISGKWRERLAEILIEFTRTRNALIIIPSLSYRPEAWIANDAIERLEVGQTSQRTIGFGSAGSQSNAPIDEIRNQLRSDPRFSGQIPDKRSQSVAAAALAGAAVGIDSEDIAPDLIASSTKSSLLPVIGKLLFALIGSSVGGWALFTAMSTYVPQANPAKQGDQLVAANDKKTAKNIASDPKNVIKGESGPGKKDVNTTEIAKAALNPASPPAEAKTLLLLDNYPPAIKASILDTARGAIDFRDLNQKPAVEEAPTKQAGSGNLFSLLEAASNSKSEPANSYSDDTVEESSTDSGEEDDSSISAEEARREAIRNRFLEAIRASALRRQAEAEEQEVE